MRLYRLQRPVRWRRHDGVLWMTSYQRARRIATWRGSFIAITFCTGWLLLSALAGTITQ
ncbi:TPA: hypothetical protein U8203_000238 [Pseudomonas putida]|nr:hypothetical protein [Pseudomonas putida]HEN8714968.1 hypothetical protein [Pseudomonas putida]